MFIDEHDRRTWGISKLSKTNPEIVEKAKEANRIADEMFMDLVLRTISWPFKHLLKLFRR